MNRKESQKPCGDGLVWGRIGVGTGAFARPAERSNATCTLSLK